MRGWRECLGVLCVGLLWVGLSGCGKQAAAGEPQPPPAVQQPAPEASAETGAYLEERDWLVLREVRKHLSGTGQGNFPDLTLRGDTVMAPLNFLTGLGAKISYQPERRSLAIVAGRHRFRYRLQTPDAPLIPVTITAQRSATTPLATLRCPYVPLAPIANALGLRMDVRPRDAQDVENVRHHLVLSRTVTPRTEPPLPTGTLTSQRVAAPFSRQDGRVRVTLSLTCAVKQPGEPYAAQCAVQVTNIGRTPVLTGDFATFLRTDRGEVFGNEVMAHRAVGICYLLQPGQSTPRTRATAILPINAADRITDVIYHDGLSVLTWTVSGH